MLLEHASVTVRQIRQYAIHKNPANIFYTASLDRNTHCNSTHQKKTLFFTSFIYINSLSIIFVLLIHFYTTQHKYIS